MKRRLVLGLQEPGQKVETLTSIRIDIFERDEAKELLNQFIDSLYDEFEEEGTDDESDENFTEQN
jgi:hypothetical protein